MAAVARKLVRSHNQSPVICPAPALSNTARLLDIDTAGHNLAPVHARAGSSSGRACSRFQSGAVRYMPN